MQKSIITAYLLVASICAMAQAPKTPQRLSPPDTAFYSALSSIAKEAIKVISESNAPANKADIIRQQLQAASQACEAYKAQLISDEQKKKQTVETPKKQ